MNFIRRLIKSLKSKRDYISDDYDDSTVDNVNNNNNKENINNNIQSHININIKIVHPLQIRAYRFKSSKKNLLLTDNSHHIDNHDNVNKNYEYNNNVNDDIWHCMSCGDTNSDLHRSSHNGNIDEHLCQKDDDQLYPYHHHDVHTVDDVRDLMESYSDRSELEVCKLIDNSHGDHIGSIRDDGDIDHHIGSHDDDKISYNSLSNRYPSLTQSSLLEVQYENPWDIFHIKDYLVFEDLLSFVSYSQQPTSDNYQEHRHDTLVNHSDAHDVIIEKSNSTTYGIAEEITYSDDSDGGDDGGGLIQETADTDDNKVVIVTGGYNKSYEVAMTGSHIDVYEVEIISEIHSNDNEVTIFTKGHSDDNEDVMIKIADNNAHESTDNDMSDIAGDNDVTVETDDNNGADDDMIEDISVVDDKNNFVVVTTDDNAVEEIAYIVVDDVKVYVETDDNDDDLVSYDNDDNQVILVVEEHNKYINSYDNDNDNLMIDSSYSYQVSIQSDYNDNGREPIIIHDHDDNDNNNAVDDVLLKQTLSTNQSTDIISINSSNSGNEHENTNNIYTKLFIDNSTSSVATKKKDKSLLKSNEEYSKNHYLHLPFDQHPSIQLSVSTSQQSHSPFHQKSSLPSSPVISYPYYMMTSTILYAFLFFIIGSIFTYLIHHFYINYKIYKKKQFSLYLNQLEKTIILYLKNKRYNDAMIKLSIELPSIILTRGENHVDTAAFKHYYSKCLLALNIDLDIGEEYLINGVMKVYEVYGEDIYMAHVLEDLALIQQQQYMNLINTAAANAKMYSIIDTGKERAHINNGDNRRNASNIASIMKIIKDHNLLLSTDIQIWKDRYLWQSYRHMKKSLRIFTDEACLSSLQSSSLNNMECKHQRQSSIVIDDGGDHLSNLNNNRNDICNSSRSKSKSSNCSTIYISKHDVDADFIKDGVNVADIDEDDNTNYNLHINPSITTTIPTLFLSPNTLNNNNNNDDDITTNVDSNEVDDNDSNSPSSQLSVVSLLSPSTTSRKKQKVVTICDTPSFFHPYYQLTNTYSSNSLSSSNDKKHHHNRDRQQHLQGEADSVHYNIYNSSDEDNDDDHGMIYVVDDSPHLVHSNDNKSMLSSLSLGSNLMMMKSLSSPSSSTQQSSLSSLLAPSLNRSSSLFHDQDILISPIKQDHQQQQLSNDDHDDNDSIVVNNDGDNSNYILQSSICYKQQPHHQQQQQQQQQQRHQPHHQQQPHHHHQQHTITATTAVADESVSYENETELSLALQELEKLLLEPSKLDYSMLCNITKNDNEIRFNDDSLHHNSYITNISMYSAHYCNHYGTNSFLDSLPIILNNNSKNDNHEDNDNNPNYHYPHDYHVGRLLRQIGNVLFLLTEYQEALVYYKLAENIYSALYEVDSIEMMSIKDDITMLLQFNTLTINERCINNKNNSITHIIDDYNHSDNNNKNVSNGINNTKEFIFSNNTDHDDNNYSKNDNDVDQHSNSSSPTSDSDISSTNISYSQYNQIVMNEDSVEYYDNPLIMIEAMSCQQNEMIVQNDSMELHYSSQYGDVDDSYYHGHGIDSNSDNSTSCNVVVDDDDDDDECHHQLHYSHRQKNSVYPYNYANPLITLSPPPLTAATVVAIDDTKVNEYNNDSLLSTTAVTIITNNITVVDDDNNDDHGDCHTVVKDRDSPSSVAFSENML